MDRIISAIRKLRVAMFSDLSEPAREGSVGNRFPLPYIFSPKLSVFDAAFLALGSLARIIFGSLLFAVWGTYTLIAWGALRNSFLRLLVVTSMVLGFLISFALLMMFITVLGNKIRPAQKPR